MIILRRYGVHILLIAVVLLAYWPVYRNGFVFDDIEYITGNPHVQNGLNLGDIRWALTATYASNWHPLTWMSHMLESQLFDMQPAGPHVTNLILHLLNVLLLFLLFFRLTGRRWPSAVVAALFGVHPLHVESVAWISERKDVLSTFFWLLTMLAYARYAEHPKLKRYGLVIGLFVLGLASKPMLVSLPFVLLLMDYWPLERMKKYRWPRLIVEKLPLLILSAGSSVITYYAQQQGGALGTAERFPIEVRIPNALVSYVSYILKMFWPVKLAVFYPHPGKNLPLWEAIAAGMALMALTILILRAGRRRPYLTVGWLWYLITLVPVIGLLQVGGQAMADRYTYIPLIGLFIMMAWGFADLRGKTAIVTMACVVVMVLVVLTRLQLRYWHNDIRLYRHALAVTGDNLIAHANLASILKDSDPKEAMMHCKAALRIKPDDFITYHTLGSILADQGRLDEAILNYRKAIKYKPDYYQAYNDLGLALMQQGKLDEAYSSFSEALKINPECAEAHTNLGILLDDLGNREEAVDHFQTAIDLNPNDTQAHFHYGVCLGRLGRHLEAIEQYNVTIRLDPNFSLAHRNLAMELYNTGDYGGAWREVHLSQRYGQEPHPNFIQALSQRMAEPNQ